MRLGTVPSIPISFSLLLISAALTQQLVLPLLFLSFPPDARSWKDPKPLVGLQENHSITEN